MLFSVQKFIDSQRKWITVDSKDDTTSKYKGHLTYVLQHEAAISNPTAQITKVYSVLECDCTKFKEINRRSAERPMLLQC